MKAKKNLNKQVKLGLGIFCTSLSTGISIWL